VGSSSITGDYLIYERVKQKNQLLGNISHGAIPIKVEDQKIEKYINPIVHKLKNMLDNLTYPWASIDIYVDNEDNVGVFEFQMEFAYEGFTPSDVKKLMTESIRYYIFSYL